MTEKRCENLQEVAQHPYTGYLLGVLHSWARDEQADTLIRIPLHQVLETRERFRAAVNFLFRANPRFNIPEISQACDHVEGLIAARAERLKPSTLPEPLAIHNLQSPIPDDILQVTDLPVPPQHGNLIKRIGFEPERDRYTQHSRAFDRAVLVQQPSNYIDKNADCGPDRACFDLLRENPCLLSSLGTFVRTNFPGIQLVDVGAGSSEVMARWAEMFKAKACINIDTNYKGNTREKRGNMDFYKLKGDALKTIANLPDGIGSFHVSGMELLPLYETGFDGTPYMRALAEEMYKKTPQGGLLFVGQLHCSLSDNIVLEAGFEPVEIPRVFSGTEAFDETQWRRTYKVYRKA